MDSLATPHMLVCCSTAFIHFLLTIPAGPRSAFSRIPYVIGLSFCATASLKEHTWIRLWYTVRISIPCIYSTNLIALHDTCIVTDPKGSISIFVCSWLKKEVCIRRSSSGQIRALAIYTSSGSDKVTNAPHSFNCLFIGVVSLKLCLSHCSFFHFWLPSLPQCMMFFL